MKLWHKDSLRIRDDEWVAGIAQGLNPVKVSVADGRVEHEVKLMDFRKSLEQSAGSPREISDRKRIRSILGLAREVFVWPETINITRAELYEEVWIEASV